MGRFCACFAPPRVLDDEGLPCKGQLQELYAGKLQQQRSLDVHKGSIKAARHAAPASAPAALAPPLQRCRPASLTIERSGSGDLDYEQACRSEAPEACTDTLPGQWQHAAGMGVGGACGDGAPGAGGTRPGHRLARAGGSRELLNSLGLARTCSPSDFSFSELLSSASGGTRAGRGGGGARRCLRFDDDASAQRALYDSRGSDGCGSVTFPTVWREDDAENCGAGAAAGHGEQAEAEGRCLRRAPSAGSQGLQAVAEEGMCELALAGAHQAAREAGLAATPATVLLAAAPGCDTGACRATASEVDERGRTCARSLPRLGAFPYLAADGGAAEALVLLPPAGTSARSLCRTITGAGVQLPGTRSVVLEAYPRRRAPPLLPSRPPPPPPPSDPNPAPRPASPPRHKRSPSGTGEEWGDWEALCAECCITDSYSF